jgi:hypothetical protein
MVFSWSVFVSPLLIKTLVVLASSYFITAAKTLLKITHPEVPDGYTFFEGRLSSQDIILTMYISNSSCVKCQYWFLDHHCKLHNSTEICMCQGVKLLWSEDSCLGERSLMQVSSGTCTFFPCKTDTELRTFLAPCKEVSDAKILCAIKLYWEFSRRTWRKFVLCYAQPPANTCTQDCAQGLLLTFPLSFRIPLILQNFLSLRRVLLLFCHVMLWGGCSCQPGVMSSVPLASRWGPAMVQSMFPKVRMLAAWPLCGGVKVSLQEVEPHGRWWGRWGYCPWKGLMLFSLVPS